MQVKSCFDDKALKMKFLSLSIVDSGGGGVTIKQVEEVVDYKIKDLPTDVDASVDTENFTVTIELKDKEGNIVSTKTIDLPITETDLSDYVKFTDIASATKAGVVKVENWTPVTLDKNGFIIVQPTTKANIDERNRNRLLRVIDLDYAWKVGAIANNEEWTDEEKASACETIGAVPTTTNIAGYFVYVWANGTNNTVKYGINASGLSIAQRTLTGGLKVPSTVEEDEAPPKKYVDDLIASLQAQIDELKNQ